MVGNPHWSGAHTHGPGAAHDTVGHPKATSVIHANSQIAIGGGPQTNSDAVGAYVDKLPHRQAKVEMLQDARGLGATAAAKWQRVRDLDTEIVNIARGMLREGVPYEAVINKACQPCLVQNHKVQAT